MDSKTIDSIRKQFEQDRFATENGAQIDECGDGFAVCSLTLADRHKNAMGAVMGGVSFMLADFAFAVAANWRTIKTVSLSANIAFVGTAKGNRLIARATCVKNGRTTAYYQIHVSDEQGNPVAEVTTTGYHVAR